MLRVQGIEKSIAGRQLLGGVDFQVQPREIVFLYGNSGCGKTSLLRIVGGLDRQHSGRVYLDDQPVVGPTARIGMVSQEASSFDWLTARRNIAFGLRYSPKNSWWQGVFGRVNADTERRVASRMAELVGLDEADLDKYPSAFSGGMKQRMSLARALVPGPDIILLDEPFSALDFEARQALQDLLLRIRDETNTAFVCVSHDPEEVVYLADRVLVLGGSPTRLLHDIRPQHAGPRAPELKYVPAFQEQKRLLRSVLTSAPGRI